MTNKSMFYNGGELLSKNRLMNFVIGNRGGGKTYHWKVRSIKDFLEHGHQFIWIRRYNTELENIKKWYDDIQHEFEGHDLEVTKKHIKIDGKIAGYIGALSTSQRLKSNSYPLVNKIIFDEFLIDKGSLRYIKGEVELMLELIETIFRHRDNNNKVIFVANAISIVNPYFTYFNIKPNLDKRFTLSKHIAIELYTNDDFINMKKKTRFGDLISNTDYGKYAIENKFLRDNYSFIIEKRPNTLIYANTLIYNNNNLGVWLCNNKDGDFLYIDNVIENSCDRVLSLSLDDLNEQCKYIKNTNFKGHIEQMKFFFNEGRVYFNNIENKKCFYEIIKLL